MNAKEQQCCDRLNALYSALKNVMTAEGHEALILVGTEKDPTEAAWAFLGYMVHVHEHPSYIAHALDWGPDNDVTVLVILPDNHMHVLRGYVPPVGAWRTERNKETPTFKRIMQLVQDAPYNIHISNQCHKLPTSLAYLGRTSDFINRILDCASPSAVSKVCIVASGTEHMLEPDSDDNVDNIDNNNNRSTCAASVSLVTKLRDQLQNDPLRKKPSRVCLGSVAVMQVLADHVVSPLVAAELQLCRAAAATLAPVGAELRGCLQRCLQQHGVHAQSEQAILTTLKLVHEQLQQCASGNSCLLKRSPQQAHLLPGSMAGAPAFGFACVKLDAKVPRTVINWSCRNDKEEQIQQTGWGSIARTFLINPAPWQEERYQRLTQAFAAAVNALSCVGATQRSIRQAVREQLAGTCDARVVCAYAAKLEYPYRRLKLDKSRTPSYYLTNGHHMPYAKGVAVYVEVQCKSLLMGHEYVLGNTVLLHGPGQEPEVLTASCSAALEDVTVTVCGGQSTQTYELETLKQENLRLRGELEAALLAQSQPQLQLQPQQQLQPVTGVTGSKRRATDDGATINRVHAWLQGASQDR